MKPILALLILFLSSGICGQHEVFLQILDLPAPANPIDPQKFNCDQIRYPAGKMTEIKMKTPGHFPVRNLNATFRILDSVYYWQLDTFLLTWKYRYRINQTTYDVNHNMTSAVQQVWNGSAWLNANKVIFAFNQHNHTISALFQVWNGMWVDDERYLYEYTPVENLARNVYQYWDGQAWQNNYQFLYTYDDQSNLLSQTYQVWYDVAWGNDYQWTYTYDEQNNLTSALYQSGTILLENYSRSLYA